MRDLLVRLDERTGNIQTSLAEIRAEFNRDRESNARRFSAIETEQADLASRLTEMEADRMAKIPDFTRDLEDMRDIKQRVTVLEETKRFSGVIVSAVVAVVVTVLGVVAKTLLHIG